MAKINDLDYKSTLNLPKTAFPMKANLAQREPKWLELWEQSNLYAGMLESTKKYQNTKKFILNDGPPYANGDIHLGHALNKILKDIIVKSQRLNGNYAPFVPGWDCHGLPIELQVEKKFGKPGRKLTPKEFRAECRKYAVKQIENQKKSFKRLGILADWDAPYLTMNYKYEADQLRGFAKIIENGHVVRGDKPVHWCLDCQDALAEAEVEYQDKSSSSIDVAYMVKNIPDELKQLNIDNLYAVIWTTTPWTLPASEGVCAHPDINYSIIEYKSKNYIVAAELLNKTLERWSGQATVNFKVQQKAIIQGSSLENLKLSHPFYLEREIPIILGDHVTIENGTGLVHTAPAHGPDDYKVGRAFNLPCFNPVLGNGCYIQELPLLGGKFIWQANKEIIELLKNNANLLQSSVINHSYPHCWRHKSPIIFRATPQWFISMDKHNLRQHSVDASSKVKWYPERGYSRFASMLSERPDWCISRQRVWGVPMGIFVHKDTGDMHPDSVEFLNKIAELVEKNGIEAWHDLEVEQFLSVEDAKIYKKSPDTLDIWFDSGIQHFCVLNQHKDLANPADVYLEGSDQHRGWFQSSMLTSVAINNKAPYKNIITTGFTVDNNGRKMSKSLGNIISPDQVINKYGADVLRLWVASTDYQRDIKVGLEIFERISDSYRRIRNTIRYLLSNIHDFEHENKLPLNELLAIDQWLINRSYAVQIEIKQAYDNFEFHKIYQLLHNFCVVDLGNFYLDVLKDRQYTCAENSQARRSGQTAMWYLLQSLIRWIAPILSFTAFETWEELYPEASKNFDLNLFTTTWFNDLKAIPVADHWNLSYWQNILSIRDEVNKSLEKARNSGVIGSGLEAELIIYCNNSNFQCLKQIENELKFLFIVSKVDLFNIEEGDVDLSDNSLDGKELIKFTSEIFNDFNIKIIKSSFVKCNRCIINIATAKGEQRLYV